MLPYILLLVLEFLLASCQGPPLEPREQSMFIWQLEDLTEDSLNILGDEGFTTLYMYCSTNDQDLFHEKLMLCEDSGMKVYAMNGSYEWIDDPEALDEFFDVIGNFATGDYPEFQGVLLDIEPYVLRDRDEEADYIVFQQLIEKGQAKARNLGIRFNTVMPFWYEKIELEGMEESDNLAYWTIRNSEEVTIMAYRNQLVGGNGIIELVDEEIDYARLVQKKAIIALETRSSREGDHISFDKASRKEVLTAMGDISDSFEFFDYRINYAVHDLESWLDLD